MRKYSILLVAVALLVLASPALAGPVTWSQATASHPVRENFDAMTAGLSPNGDPYVGIYEAYYADFAETFTGLTVLESGGFEYFNLTAADVGNDKIAGSLSMATPGTNDGLYGGLVTDDGTMTGTVLFTGTGGMNGTAADNGDDPDIIGEGVMSVHFDWSQTEIGLTVLGVDTGQVKDASTMTVNFWSQTGVLVDRVLIFNPVNAANYKFSSTTAFRGISIENTDAQGLAYDNFRYSAPDPVPEPATLALFGIGAAGLAVSRRRKAKQS